MVIGIGGRLGSGKDAIAQRLVERWGFTKIGFSYALKEEVLERLPRTLRWIHDMQCPTCGGGDRAACIRRMVYDTKPPGIRELLQEYGSEVRRRDDPAYWVRQWMNAAQRTERVVAPDVRFPNELAAVRQLGGVLWRVVRPGEVSMSPHISETAVDEARWDWVIGNDGTLSDLRDSIDRYMERFFWCWKHPDARVER